METGEQELVDNSHHVYRELKLSNGIIILFRDNIPQHCPEVFSILEEDITQSLKLLPRSVHPLVKRTRIWVNASYLTGQAKSPVSVNHLISHHHVEWLWQARDNARKVNGIEIYSAKDYCRMRLHWNGCGLILHELCHLIHQHALPDGLLNADVQSAYRNADKSGRFEQVLRRDWAGKKVNQDLAYCMIDQKEFFSELSVAFLARNYKELDCGDPSFMEACSPQIRHPDVLRRLETSKLSSESTSLLKTSSTSGWKCCWKKRTDNFPHCNKFYPFTHGQLYVHHRPSYLAIESLWQQISNWSDPEVSHRGFLWLGWGKIPCFPPSDTSDRNSQSVPGGLTYLYPDTVVL